MRPGQHDTFFDSMCTGTKLGEHCWCPHVHWCGSYFRCTKANRCAHWPKIANSLATVCQVGHNQCLSYPRRESCRPDMRFTRLQEARGKRRPPWSRQRQRRQPRARALSELPRHGRGKRHPRQRDLPGSPGGDRGGDSQRRLESECFRGIESFVNLAFLFCQQEACNMPTFPAFDREARNLSRQTCALPWESTPSTAARHRALVIRVQRRS